ncbi:hypothetical protein [Gloeocapsa sp. PCC 7428]|nr:hypothetical protein [Gloeocapsa sp. PCC 7428]
MCRCPPLRSGFVAEVPYVVELRVSHGKVAGVYPVVATGVELE